MLGFIGLMSLGVLNLRRAQQLEQTFHDVSHSHAVRAHLVRLLSLVQDVQMGQRGYILTGEKAYLDPYEAALAHLEPQIARLQNLLDKSPEQKARFTMLLPEIHRRVAHARELILIRDTQGFEAAQHEVMSGRGKAMTDSIRRAIQEIDRAEASRLAANVAAAQRASDVMHWVLLSGYLFSFALLGGACVVLVRENNRRRAAEAELRRKTMLLEAVLNSIGEGIAVADQHRKLIVFNPAARQILGSGLTDAASDHWAAHYGLFLPDKQTPFPADDLPLVRACRGESTEQVELFVRSRERPEGAWLCVTGRPLASEEGSLGGGVVVFQDITERKAVEAQVAEANRELMRRNEEIQNFYHIVSHELKTPLTSAREFISLVLEGLAGPISPQQAEYLGIAKGSCDQLRVCINDLLDTTRLETGKLALQVSRAPVRDVIERVVAMFKPAAEAKHLELRAEIPVSSPEAFFDDGRITQVLTNLIANALKFTPENGKIVVRAHDPGPQANFIEISVSDTGCGIAPEKRERIFDRLYQARVEDAAVKGGLGLGLHICRGLVRMHGGEIHVNSEINRGSTFTFTLPKQPITQQSDDPAETLRNAA